MEADWRKAGDSANRILLTLASNYSQFPTNSTLCFVDLPLRFNRAWVYPVGLDDAIWFIYQTDDLMVKKADISQAEKECLDKPLVYIEPDASDFSWSNVDISPDLRAGEVANSMEALVDAIKISFKEPKKYSKEREKVREQVLGSLDGGAAQRGVEGILGYYPRFIEW